MTNSLKNFRLGPLGGDWVARGAGSVGYIIPCFLQGGSYRNLTSLPAGWTYAADGTQYAWQSNPGLEAPDRSSHSDGILYGSTLTWQFRPSTDWAGIISVYMVNGPGENRSEKFEWTFGSLGGPIADSQSPGAVFGNTGGWMEWDVTIDASTKLSLVTTLLSGANTVLTAIMFAPAKVAAVVPPAPAQGFTKAVLPPAFGFSPFPPKAF